MLLQIVVRFGGVRAIDNYTTELVGNRESASKNKIGKLLDS